jgi:glucokinase
VADRPRPSIHLGLDLGGTNIKWAVVSFDGSTWAIVDRDQVATHADAGPKAVVALLADVAREAMVRRGGISTLGVGVPGPYDPAAGTIRDLTNFPGDWTDVPVARVVAGAAGVPVQLINDARAFGLAELRLGAGRGASTMVGVTLGTGLGGVIAIDGRVLQGHDGAAGELGHQTIDPDGPLCNCGNRGCVEAFVRADRIAAACGTASVDEAVDRARGGDALAQTELMRVGHYLGIGLANVITVLTPDRVVIGGGGAASLDLFLDAIWDELHARVFMTRLDRVEIVPAEMGVWAGAIGAALHGSEVAATPAATYPRLRT